MKFYNHWIGDYQRDTNALSLAENGAYQRLLDAFYASESPLPDDWRKLFRLTGAMDQDEQDAVRSVITKFWNLTADGWVQERAQREINEGKKRIETARENGKKGGRPRRDLRAVT